MAGLIARRLLALLPLLFLVSLGVFSLTLLLPGDPAITLAGGDGASPEAIAEIRKQLRLDDPFPVRYARWLGDAVQLDFGVSLENGRPVSDELAARFPVTFGIATAAVVVALLVGVPAGVLGGLRPGSAIDRLGVLAASTGIAIPSFWMAMLLVAVFSVELGWLPAIGYRDFSSAPLDWLRHVALPAIALGSAAAASLARQLRAALIDVLGTHYVRTAWAKGAKSRRVIAVHALRNAALPAITILGLQWSALLGGTVIIEQIFGIPGLGTWALRAILSNDLPVIQGVTIVFVLVHVLFNLLVDLSYGWLDPRIRAS
jgi:peptide/nickel transport system permease protein